MDKILKIDLQKLPQGNGVIIMTAEEAVREFHFDREELKSWEREGMVPIVIEDGVAKFGNENIREAWMKAGKPNPPKEEK